MTEQYIDQAPVAAPASRPKDRPLNPYRFPCSAPARELVARISSQVDAQLHALKPRLRKRRATDRQTFEATVTAVVSDLIYECFEGEPKGISLSRSNKWPPRRYQTPVHNKLLPGILDALAQGGLGYVHQTTGQLTFAAGGLVTSLLPTMRLRQLVASTAVSYGDIEGGQGGEVVHLIGPQPIFGSADLLNYPETDETTRLRAEMVTINGWLANAELWVDEDRYAGDRDYPDLSKRWLIRRFTQGSLEAGGRLWGGFWPEMKKEVRREALQIDGEPAVELDFGQAGARILYGMARAQVPQVDLYAVPGFEQHRDGIRSAVASMSFATRRLVRFPPEMKSNFGKGHTMTKVVEAVEAFHQPIAHLFFNGAGHRIQRIESDIIVETLLRLIDRGVTALPIHDAVMVSRHSAQVAGEVMLEVFRELAGVEGKLSSHPPDALSLSLLGGG